MKNLFKLILIAIVMAGCQIQTTSVTPPPDPTVVAPPAPTPLPAPPAPKTACEAAQEHLEAMCAKDGVMNQYCCAVVMVTKKGKPFAQFCEEEQAKGIWINPECLSSITDCNDIDSCNNQNQPE